MGFLLVSCACHMSPLLLVPKSPRSDPSSTACQFRVQLGVHCSLQVEVLSFLGSRRASHLILHLTCLHFFILVSIVKVVGLWSEYASSSIVLMPLANMCRGHFLMMKPSSSYLMPTPL